MYPTDMDTTYLMEEEIGLELKARGKDLAAAVEIRRAVLRGYLKMEERRRII